MKLELYHRWGCPYSKKVRDFIDQHGLRTQITYKELDEAPENIEKLVQLTGQQQVPCLVIDGKPMLESNEIIKWMQSHLSGEQQMASL